MPDEAKGLPTSGEVGMARKYFTQWPERARRKMRQYVNGNLLTDAFMDFPENS